MPNSKCLGRLAVVAVGGALVALAGGTARAQVTYELLPSAGLGATDNAANVPKPTPSDSADGFGTLSGIARVRSKGARAEHVAGVRASWLHYLLGRGPDSFSGELSWLSTLNLLASLELRLAAAGFYGQTSSAPVDVQTFTPQATTNGTRRYLGANASETLQFQRTATNRYTETFGVNLLRYLGAGSSTVVNLDARLRAEWVFGRNDFGGELVASRIESPGQGTFVLGSASAVWRRELSLEWAGELRAGGVAVVPPTGATLVAPTGQAAIEFRRLTWFATLLAGQTPTLNVYVGNATINDNVVARLTLPLTRSEHTVLGAYGGLVYGREVGGGRAYDQRSGGAALAVRGTLWPLWLSLDYTISDQNGNTDTGGLFPSIRRQVVMLNVGAAFVFGPGTTPIFPGTL